MKPTKNSLSLLWKKIIFFSVIDLVLVLLLSDVLMGKLTFNILPARSSYPAQQELNQHGAAEKITNIVVKKLEAKTKNENGSFAVGAEIDFTCEIVADNIPRGSAFSAVIKNGTKEITRERLTSANEEKNTWDIVGTYKPTKSDTEDLPGLQPFACRVDTEQNIEEDNERDNREVLFLFIAGDR